MINLGYIKIDGKELHSLAESSIIKLNDSYEQSLLKKQDKINEYLTKLEKVDKMCDDLISVGVRDVQITRHWRWGGDFFETQYKEARLVYEVLCENDKDWRDFKYERFKEVYECEALRSDKMGFLYCIKNVIYNYYKSKYDLYNECTIVDIGFSENINNFSKLLNLNGEVYIPIETYNKLKEFSN